MCGYLHEGDLLGGLSGVTGNCHAPFLGGLGLATAPGYPTRLTTERIYNLNKINLLG